MDFIRPECLKDRDQAAKWLKVTPEELDAHVASGALPPPKWVMDDLEKLRRKLAGEPEHQVVVI